MRIKQFINIEIERELTKKEHDYILQLTIEEKEQLIKEHIKEIHEIFEQADILDTHFKKINIRYE